MKKWFMLFMGLVLVIGLTACGGTEKSSDKPPTEKNVVEIMAQGAIKKYMNKKHGTDLDASDVTINNIEKKDDYTTNSGKEMVNSWFIEAEADGVMITTTIDFPNDKDFSITFLNYGLKNEINDIKQ